MKDNQKDQQVIRDNGSGQQKNDTPSDHYNQGKDSSTSPRTSVMVHADEETKYYSIEHIDKEHEHEFVSPIASRMNRDKTAVKY